MIAQTGRRLEKAPSRSDAARVGAKRAPARASDVEGRARELLTMAAHDLRSPLASIGFRSHGLVQRWKAGEKPPCDEWAPAVLAICAAAEEASCMIDDLLALERLDQVRRAPRRLSVIDIQSVIENAIDREKLALERARCPVTVLRKAGLASARGAWDRPYLLRVFGNLLRNAAHHAAGAPILITLARRGDRLGIVFSDRGPGLPEPGRRGEIASRGADDAQPTPGIHGLGLWIVRRAVQRLGGRLRIRNGVDAGLTFDIELTGLERWCPTDIRQRPLNRM